MPQYSAHEESHLVHRVGWLRAAVMGANDGIVSTGSLIVGVAAAASDHTSILLAGLAGLVAGAMSMAAGEYVSVSSQADTERADLAKEAAALRDNPDGELYELSMIYQERGLDEDLAQQVAVQLSEKDALGAHARDELGISEVVTARPIQAALASGLTFSIGAAVPLAVAVLMPLTQIIYAVTVTSLLCLAVLGALSAHAGGAPKLRAITRVTVWGALAMAATAAIGALFGAVV